MKKIQITLATKKISSSNVYKNLNNENNKKIDEHKEETEKIDINKNEIKKLKKN